MEEIINKFSEDADKAIVHFEEELKKLRTGRAHPGMVDGVMAEAYGQKMPLIQLATISTPEPQLIQISPFDPNNLEAISSSIRENQTLGLNPMDDGKVIRVQIPPLTEERRKQIVKQLGEKVEDCMISMRNARHDGLKQAKSGDFSDDDKKHVQNRIDEEMSSKKKQVEELAKAKEQEILKI
ncbi:MAG TPA: ribosome recycling factor [Candidatus Saccharimonadales bacterium]|nr:ribosome recycling factor [Candidatus Saccharimonadales bacterium]